MTLACALLMLAAGVGLTLVGTQQLDTTIQRETRDHSLSWLRRHTLLEARHAARAAAERRERVELAAAAVADVVRRRGPGPLDAGDRSVERIVFEERDVAFIEAGVPAVTAAARASTTDDAHLASLCERAADLGDVVRVVTRGDTPIQSVSVWIEGEGVLLAEPPSSPGRYESAASDLLRAMPIEMSRVEAAATDGWHGPYETTSGRAISYQTAITDAAGSEYAWVRVVLDFDEIAEVLEAGGGIRPHAATLLLARDRTPLHVPQAAFDALGIAPDTDNRALRLDDELTQLLGDSDRLPASENGMTLMSEQAVSAACSVPNSDWCVVSALPRYTAVDTAFDASRRSRDVAERIGAAMLVLSVLFGGMAVFAGVRFAAWLQKRLAPLQDSAVAMASGDLSKHIPVRGQDEIASVAIALNTSRVRLQSTLARLQESQRRIAVLIQSMTEGFVITDSEDRISFANDRFASLLKRSLDDVIGRTIPEMLTADSIAIYRRELALRHAGENGRYEVSWIVSDGRKARTIVSAMPLMDEEGRVIGACGVVTDVTKRTEAQRETARSEKLRALGEMAGGVAHDFNNVLAAILGNAQFLLMEGLTGEAAEAARVIERAALDGTETVRRIREFTRPRSGLLESEAVDANAIVKDVVAFVKQRVDEIEQEHGISITVVGRKNARREIHGNPSELRETMLNLVLNALDAMPLGGTVTVESFDRGEDSVGLRVTDTGTGIDPEVRDKIFDPFFSTKPAGPSSGLGLSICYGIVRAHDGRIDVRTSKDGTTFTIVLPAYNARSDSTGDTVGSAALPPSPRILHVSAHGRIAERLRCGLESRGVELIGVGTYGEAAKILGTTTNNSLNVLITELALGRDSGWQLCRLARRSRPALRIVLLAEPGHGIDDTPARHAGIDRVLTRPFDIDDVHSVVISALGDTRVAALQEGTTTEVILDADDTFDAWDDPDRSREAAEELPATLAAFAERSARPRRHGRDDNVYIDEHTVAALDFILKRSGVGPDRNEAGSPASQD